MRAEEVGRYHGDNRGLGLLHATWVSRVGHWYGRAKRLAVYIYELNDGIWN